MLVWRTEFGRGVFFLGKLNKPCGYWFCQKWLLIISKRPKKSSEWCYFNLTPPTDHGTILRRSPQYWACMPLISYWKKCRSGLTSGDTDPWLTHSQIVKDRAIQLLRSRSGALVTQYTSQRRVWLHYLFASWSVWYRLRMGMIQTKSFPLCQYLLQKELVVTLQTCKNAWNELKFCGTLFQFVFICVFYNVCILYLSYGGRVESEVWRGRGGSKRYNRQAAVSYNGQQGCLTMGRAYAITPLQVIQVIRTHTHTHSQTHKAHIHTQTQSHRM